eukprot:22015-Ditylum_brightwellii.AAC.1
MRASIPQQAQKSAADAKKCFARARDTIIITTKPTKTATTATSGTAPILTLLLNGLRNEQGGGGSDENGKNGENTTVNEMTRKTTALWAVCKRKSSGDLPRWLPFR